MSEASKTQSISQHPKFSMCSCELLYPKAPKAAFKQTLSTLTCSAKRLGCIFSRRTSPPSLVVPAEINVHYCVQASPTVSSTQASFASVVGKSVQVVQALRMKRARIKTGFEHLFSYLFSHTFFEF